jgi:parallel beta-helix repeat protein
MNDLDFNDNKRNMASDAQMSIQSRLISLAVLAGILLGVGAAGAVNINSCTNINSSGTYTLTTDILNDGNNSCINITSSNVIFDGQGYTIDGIRALTSRGVYVYNSTTTLTNVTIKNLTLTDWDISIYCSNSSNGGIENNNVILNSFGIYLNSSTNNIITNNNASMNNNTGIYFLNSDSNNLTNNTANSNAYDGIYLYTSDSNNLTNNTANSNSFSGIYLFRNSTNNIIVNNTASDNIVGIYIWEDTTQPNTIQNNTLGGNIYSTYTRIAPTTGSRNCRACHINSDISPALFGIGGYPAFNPVSLSRSRHFQLNNLTVNDNEECWACHNNGSAPTGVSMGQNKTNPWRCPDCHTPSGSQYSKYPAPSIPNHVPDNVTFYNATIQTNASNAYCTDCHQNSMEDTTGTTDGGGILGMTLIANVSHYLTNTSLVVDTGLNCTYCHRQLNSTVRDLWGTNVSLSYWPTSNTSFVGNIRHETNVSYCNNCHGNLSPSITLHSDQVTKEISVHYAFDWEGDDGDEWPPWDEVPIGPARDNREESCFACHLNGMVFTSNLTTYKICEDCHLPNGTGPFNYSTVTGFGDEAFVLRSDLQPWSISNREALGIPIIYSHVPYNAIWNISDVQVKRNLSGLTGETGMSTRSSCFSWNPSTNNGTCHGVSYAARFNATPPADANEGKFYFMHYPENEYSTGVYYFNQTYMNTYIQDYAPNTTDCLWCHNQSNTSVRAYWGYPIQVKLNSTGGYDPNAMYGAQSNSDCYNCHVDSRQQPENFHVEEINEGLDCALCHFNFTTMNDTYNVPEKWINETLYDASVHGNRSVIYCTNCHGHPPPESRWHWCEDCHVVMPKYANGTPIKDAQQRHNMTFKPQYNYVNVSGNMISVINVTDCTVCHDTTAYNQARSTFNSTGPYGNGTNAKDCRYCHSFPDLNADSRY